MIDFKGVAALTIVSKNYISVARVLCDSFLENHPGADFYVLLVDIMDGEFDIGKEKFKPLFLAEIGLPGADIFPYQYTILELNTAVKPFALKHLLRNRNIEKLAYIDPDILVAKALDKVWNALDDHSVVLTPHMREPFNDNASPSEIGILQSGTYNLGFIGLKNNNSSRKLLDWWIGKLYLDCVVDIPNGLFVDQKWMDLVPAYYHDTYILHDPSYNAAYWNLHEREITKKNGDFFVDGLPLSFFHFSGYNPLKPDLLSKHQNRHELADNRVLASLFELYASKLLDADYVASQQYRYAYGFLANEIPVSRCFHKVIRHCLRHHIAFPSPAEDPDSFCEFMMSPTSLLFGYLVPPVVHGILMIREDVLKHYPDAWYGLDENFLGWLNNSGKVEENLSVLLEQYGHCMKKRNSVQHSMDVYHGRGDLRASFPDMATNLDSFNGFCNWIRVHGVKEENLSDTDASRLERARNGFHKVLILYFMRPDLQKAFPRMHRDATAFFHWLLENLKYMPFISEDEAYLFYGLSKYSRKFLEKTQLRLNRALRDKAGAVLTNFNIDQYLKAGRKQFDLKDRSLLARLTTGESTDICASPLQQLEVWYCSSPQLMKSFPNAFDSPDALAKLYSHLNGFAGLRSIFRNRKWLKQLAKQVANYQPDDTGVNISGYFDAPTGMGQSSRSMLKTVQAANLKYSVKNLPNMIVEPDINLIGTDLASSFGSSCVENRVNVIVANADSVEDTIDFYPPSDMHGRRNIGYWVWETETLPACFRKSATDLDEVWTPSEYSANSIRKCIDIPVHVLPHVLDFGEIDAVAQKGKNRSKFGLPQNGILLGYFFDQKSVLERKNPQGVIDAFRIASEKHPLVKMHLVLKVNDPRPGDLEYELLKSENDDLEIIWLEETMRRDDTLELMNCLDIYISLHRSEGFGLTIAEAMAFGKPVIASKYSGNLEFMDDQSAILIDTPTIRTRRSYGPYPNGTIWGNPDIQQAADGIIRLLDSSISANIGATASERVRNLLSPEKIANKMVRLLDNSSIMQEKAIM